MEQEKIQKLLGKFYEGTTSEEEEAQLREYLSDPLVSSLFPEAEYFMTCRSAVPEPSEGFREKLEAVTRTGRKMAPRGKALRYSMTIAAGAALLLGSYFLFDYMRPQHMKDTFSDPMMAMAEVKNILTVVSNNMNTGTESLGSIRAMSMTPEAMSEFGRINKEVENDLGRLRYLNGLKAPASVKENN
ncbi:MAG: hypothetical protein WCD55_05045 [Bacteroidales bacterium]